VADTSWPSVQLWSRCYRSEGGVALPGAANPGVLALEALDASGGVDQLLLAGKEGVAARADFHADVAFMGGASAEGASAGADYIDFLIGWMNAGFHEEPFPERYKLRV